MTEAAMDAAEPADAADSLLDEVCAREPIHIPGAVQPHGALLVLAGAPGAGGLEATLIQQASLNAAALLGCAVDPLRQRCTLAEALGESGQRLTADLQPWLASDDPVFDRRTVLASGEPAMARALRLRTHVILEIEPIGANPITSEDLAGELQTALGKLNSSSTLEALYATAAQCVRTLTGFDRVLIYQFDKDANGTVVAEDRNERLPCYLDLRFPASDIPRQARDLYRLNRLRLIPIPAGDHPARTRLHRGRAAGFELFQLAQRF